MESETLDQMMKRYVEAVSAYEAARTAAQAARRDYETADRKVGSLREQLATFVGVNVPSKMIRLDDGRTAVVRYQEDWKEATIEMFDRSGELV